MAECEQTSPCPYAKMIEAAYEKVVTGNGDLPLPERVRNLEAEMASAMPILLELQSSAQRQEGRAQERIQNEARNDKRTKAFRWWVMAILTMIGVLLSFYVGEKALEDSHKGLLKLPQFPSHNRQVQVYANSNNGSQDATFQILQAPR